MGFTTKHIIATGTTLLRIMYYYHQLKFFNGCRFFMFHLVLKQLLHITN